MCTIGYIKDKLLVFKNRDKTAPVTEEVIANADYIICRTVGERHISCGFNKYGCGFVTAAVNEYFWPCDNDQYSPKSQTPPSLELSLTLPKVESLDYWLEYLSSDNIIWQGGNIILFDKDNVKLAEFYGKSVKITACEKDIIRANHFNGISYACPDDRKTGQINTFEREKRVQEALPQINHLADLQAILVKPVETGTDGIWMSDIKGGLITVSSNIIDIANLIFYHCDKAGGNFTEYRL